MPIPGDLFRASLLPHRVPRVRGERVDPARRTRRALDPKRPRIITCPSPVSSRATAEVSSGVSTGGFCKSPGRSRLFLPDPSASCSGIAASEGITDPSVSACFSYCPADSVVHCSGLAVGPRLSGSALNAGYLAPLELRNRQSSEQLQPNLSVRESCQTRACN